MIQSNFNNMENTLELHKMSMKTNWFIQAREHSHSGERIGTPRLALIINMNMNSILISNTI